MVFKSKLRYDVLVYSLFGSCRLIWLPKYQNNSSRYFRQKLEDWKNIKPLDQKLPFYRMKLLTDWFARKNVDNTVIIVYNIYYWYESGSFDYWQYCSPPIWKCILRVCQADRVLTCFDLHNKGSQLLDLYESETYLNSSLKFI